MPAFKYLTMKVKEKNYPLLVTKKKFSAPHFKVFMSANSALGIMKEIGELGIICEETEGVNVLPLVCGFLCISFSFDAL